MTKVENRFSQVMTFFIITMLLALAFSWSIWFMSNHNNPREFKSYEEIERYCGAGYEHTEYCLGFASGYNWAADQVLIDRQLQKINWETFEKYNVDEND